MAAHLVKEARVMAVGKTPCGIAIPQCLASGSGYKPHSAIVQKAETLGYDSLWVQESIVGHVPVLEPLSLLTYAAALTSRLRLGTSVMLTVLRNPVQLAKLVASLDQLSQGRLTVGIGIGGHVPESIFGLPSGQRVRRFVEGIQVMKALWTQSQAQVSGTFWQFQNVAMEPKPVQKPHPPIWFGARQAPALQRAVRHGDGWMGAGWSPRQTLSSSTACCGVSWMRRSATRRPSWFPSASMSPLITTAAALSAACVSGSSIRYRSADMGSQCGIWGSTAECTEKLAAIVRAGAQHLLLNPMFDDLEHLEMLAQEVMPYL